MIKGNFEWEDNKFTLDSSCELPAFGLMSVYAYVRVCSVNADVLDNTPREVLERHGTPPDNILYLETKSPYKDIMNKKIRDIVKYKVSVYRAATDCDLEIISDNFKTMDDAKRFAEDWYTNEIRKFFGVNYE